MTDETQDAVEQTQEETQPDAPAEAPMSGPTAPKPKKPKFPVLFNCAQYKGLRIYIPGTGRTNQKTPDGRVKVDEKLRAFIEFRNGVAFATNQTEYDILKAKPYVYEADLPKGRECKGCGRRWHAMDALLECERSHPTIG